jgi:hypothetical protein
MKDPFNEIPAFAKVTDIVYRGGQPKPAGLRTLKNLVKAILCLRQDEKRVQQERSCAQAGF